MNVKYYRGQRVYLRPLELDDCDALVVWLNDPDNWRTLGRTGPLNRLREREFVEGLYKSPENVVFGIALTKSDALVGTCGLHDVSLPDRRATFGILIGERSQQGLGLGSEATRLMVRYGFEELNLNRIDLGVLADNERGVRAYRRAGFIEEGRQRQAYFRNGRYHDALQLAILREDWEYANVEAHSEARLSSMMT